MAAEILEKISKAVTEGDDDTTNTLVAEALNAGMEPLAVLNDGVVAGILETGERWHRNEYFLPDVIMSAEAFKAGMELLDPRLKQTGQGRHGKKFVIGVVEGDMHDLGKSLVVAMLTSAGFDVIDLGIDVPRARFIEAVQTHKPAVVGLGAYMTTTMLGMKEIIGDLKREGLRDGTKVMVGGVPTSQEFADEVGADAWGKDALDAMQKAMTLAGI